MDDGTFHRVEPTVAGPITAIIQLLLISHTHHPLKHRSIHCADYHYACKHYRFVRPLITCSWRGPAGCCAPSRRDNAYNKWITIRMLGGKIDSTHGGWRMEGGKKTWKKRQCTGSEDGGSAKRKGEKTMSVETGKLNEELKVSERGPHVEQSMSIRSGSR